MEKGRGNPFGPDRKPARSPGRKPNWYPPPSLFLSLTAGPTCRHHQLWRIFLPLFSLETAAGIYSPAVIARTNGPSRPVYKRPQHSSSISLSSSCMRHRQDRGIPRRTSVSLRASPIDSDLASEPHASSSPLSPPPLSGTPSDVFILISLVANRAPHRRLKSHGRYRRSSRTSSPFQEKREHADLAFDISASWHILSTISLPPEATREPSPSTIWPLPRRRWPEI
jgi:hypothetical protein